MVQSIMKPIRWYQCHDQALHVTFLDVYAIELVFLGKFKFLMGLELQNILVPLFISGNLLKPWRSNIERPNIS